MIRRQKLFSAALLAVFALGNTLPAYSQEAHKEEPKKEEPKKEEPKRDQKAVEYEKAIKDLPKYEGAFTLYVRKKDILLELPEANFGKLFMIQAAFNTGWSTNVQQGLPIQSPSWDSWGAIDTYAIEKKGEERVWLTRPNTKFRWDKDDSLAEAISRSFPKAYLADMRIEQYNPERKVYLINASNLFSGELLNLSQTLSALGGMPLTPDREKTGVDKVKGFPTNTTLRMDMYYTSTQAPATGFAAMLAAMMGGNNNLEDRRSVNFKISYNIYFRPVSDYKPRIADSRVGYFTQDFTNFNRYLKADRMTRYVTRWNLKKKDPAAAISEPVKPILWTVDNSVPKEYRDAAKKGILLWNKAFEKLGYKNAVQVQDVPNDPDYDHADGRYNVYRWSVTNGYDGAIALPRIDPFTGEILNSAVNFDATFVFAGQQEFDQLVVPSAQMARALSKQALLHSSTDPRSSSNAMKAMFNPNYSASQVLLGSILDRSGWSKDECHFAAERGKRLQMDFISLKAGGNSKITKKELVDQYVTDVTAHEIGHCMGLRHNFVASANLTTAELANDALVAEQGFSASVMDYTDINAMAVLKGSGIYFNSTVGPYDIHAIRYGYTDIKADTPEGEKFALSQIASQGGKRGLEFMTDEDADGEDPRVVRFDGARDPLNYLTAESKVAAKTLAYVLANYPAPGESYAKRNKIIVGLIGRKFQDGMSAARFIGGINGNRTFKGDSGESANLRPVEADQQRQGLNLILTSCFSDKAFDFPESVLNSMGNDYDTGTSSGWTAPIRSLVSSQQMMMLSALMGASRLDNISENAFKLKEKPGTYMLNEHYGKIVANITAEISNGTSISPLRRDLQRYLVDNLIDQAGSMSGGVNEDSREIANQCILAIRSLCTSYSKAKTNAVSQSHIATLAAEIDRFTKRQRVEGIAGGGGGGAGLDLRSLLGQKP